MLDFSFLGSANVAITLSAKLRINCLMFVIVDYLEFRLIGVSFHSELVLCLLLYWCIANVFIVILD